MAANSFASLIGYASVAPVVVAGALNTTPLVAGALGTGVIVAGIVDPITLQKIFNPQAEGNSPASGDTLAAWLPTLTAISSPTVTDSYWSSIPGVTDAVANVGLVTLQLTPAAKNVVEASSVMTFKVSPQALVLYYAAGYTTHEF
jgi:hypothetical protein